jgi:hypothetical protein
MHATNRHGATGPDFQMLVAGEACVGPREHGASGPELIAALRCLDLAEAAARRWSVLPVGERANSGTGNAAPYRCAFFSARIR